MGLTLRRRLVCNVRSTASSSDNILDPLYAAASENVTFETSPSLVFVLHLKASSGTASTKMLPSESLDMKLEAGATDRDPWLLPQTSTKSLKSFSSTSLSGIKAAKVDDAKRARTTTAGRIIFGSKSSTSGELTS